MESIIKSDQQPKVSSHRIELTLLEQQTGTFFSSKEREVEKWIITFRVQPTNEDTPNDIRNKKQQAASSNVERGIRQILQRAHAKIDHLSSFDACTFDGCFPFRVSLSFELLTFLDQLPRHTKEGLVPLVLNCT
jgi:hypothetical protein